MTDDTPKQQEGGTVGRSSAEARGAGSTVAPLAALSAIAAERPSRPALTFSGRTLTYSALDAAVRSRALALQRLGLMEGGQLATLLPSSPASLIYDLAARAAGSAAFPLDQLDTVEAQVTALITGGARVVITSDAATPYAMAAGLLARGALDRMIVVPQTSQVSATAALRLRLGASLARVPATPHGPIIRESVLLRETASAHIPPPLNRPANPATDFFARAAAARSANIGQLLAVLPPLGTGTERIMVAVPLSDPMALSLVLGIGLAHAAELIIPESLDTDDLARSLAHHAPTLLMTSIAMLSGLLESPRLKQRSCRELKATLTLGPPAGRRSLSAFAAFSQAPVIETYGARAIAAFAQTQAGDPSTASAAFQPLGNTRFVVRDLADPAREVPRGERGALHVSGPQFELSSGDTSFATGDVGLIDAGGHLVVIDRINQLIIAAGYMIYPSRIEAALLEHPGVAGAAVLGVSDGRRGMAPKAFVLLKSGAALTERDLTKHLSTRISKIEMPAVFEFCSTLPRDAYGAVDKNALGSKPQPRT